MAAKGEILDARKPGADLILDGYRYAQRISDKNGTVRYHGDVYIRSALPP